MRFQFLHKRRLLRKKHADKTHLTVAICKVNHIANRAFYFICRNESIRKSDNPI